MFCFAKLSFTAFALCATGWILAAERIVIKGSDTLGAKMIPQLAEEFKALKSQQGENVIFEIAAEGSSTGITAVITGSADLGMSSREAKDMEISKATLEGVEMTGVTVAKDGVAIVVNESNPLRAITSREVMKIFTGDVERWVSINGEPDPISIYTRNTSSGTYSSFQQLALRKRDYAQFSQKMAGNEQIASEVSTNAYGIGYVGLAYIETPGISVLPVDGLMPQEPGYKFSRPLYLYFDKANKLRPVVEEFLGFCISPEAQAIVEKVHFISIFQPASVR